MAKRFVHRHEDGHDESYYEDFGESQYDDEGNEIHDEEAENLGDLATDRDPTEEHEDIAREQRSDEEALEELEEANKKAYEERQQKERAKRVKSREHAISGERVKQGILGDHSFQPQSKRLLHWAVIQDREPENVTQEEPIVSEAGVTKLKERLDKARSHYGYVTTDSKIVEGSLMEERRDLERQLKQTTGILDPKHREERAGRIARKLHDIDVQREQGKKQVADLEKQFNWANDRWQKVTGRVGQLGAKSPPGPAGRTDSPSAPGRQSIPTVDHLPVDAQARKAEVKRYHQLAQKLLQNPGGPAKRYRVKFDDEGNVVNEGATRGLTKDEYKEFVDLKRKLRSYRVVVQPDAEGREPDRAARENVKKQAEYQYHNVEFLPVSAKRRQELIKQGIDVSGVKTEETPEDTIGKYGQENVHMGLVKGWTATTKFNKEQARRKYKALLTGEASMGWNGFNSTGVAPEKAKYTAGPNREWLMEASDWKPENPKASKQGQDKFTFTVKNSGRERSMNDEGEMYEEGLTVGDTIRSLGLELSEPKATDKPGEFTVTTNQGEHLNPDQIAALQETLHLNHQMATFKSKGTVGFTRTHKRVPVGYSKAPKDFDEGESLRSSRRLYSGHAGVRLGQRDRDTNELLPDERDSIGFRVGNRTFQRHFKDSSDAIGWGTSWRPGEKEISSALLAVPHFRQQKEMAEAWEASKLGNDSKMKDYLEKYYPDDDEAERKEHISKAKKEGAAVSSALVAGGYYSAKKHWPRRLGNATWAGFERVPGIGPASHNFAESHGLTDRRGSLFKDTTWVARRTKARMMDRAKFRVQHPLTSGALDAEGNIIPDPTVPGIMFHNEHKPNLNALSAVYNRQRFIHPAEREGRKYQKQIATLRGEIHTQQGIVNVLSGAKDASPAERRMKLWQARSLLHDPQRKATRNVEQQLQVLKTEVDTKLKSAKAPLELFGMKENTTLNKQPLLKTHLKNTQRELNGLLKDIASGPNIQHEHLDHLVRSYAAQHPSKVPHAIWSIGKLGLGGAALVGTGVLAVDRYQTYETNKGEHIDHPILKAITPERIMWPKVKVQRTKELKIPNNAVTDALDLQGEKIPVAGRISVTREQKARLRNHQDISGEKYKSGLPLLGGIGFKAPAPMKGSLKDSVVHQSSRSPLGPTKNMYVLGKKVPLDIAIGKKERWDNKSHRLRASNNRYKLDQEDREHLVQLATWNPRQGMYSDPSMHEHVRNFYYNDEKLNEMMANPKEVERIRKKHKGWMPTSEKEIKDIRDKGIGELSEETQQRRRNDRRARKDYAQQRIEEMRARTNNL